MMVQMQAEESFEGFEETQRTSKFIKRIIGFFRPFKYRFADIPNTRNNQKYVRLGCAFVHSALQSAEGARFLGDCKLMRQLAECLAQCDPVGLGSPLLE